MWQTFKQRFPSYGWFTGTIEKYVAARGQFYIVYNDGDTMHMTLDKLSKFLKGDEQKIVKVILIWL
jgi:hypothetical protein